MRSSKILIIALLSVSAVLFPVDPSSAAPSIKINTIVYNPGGRDTGSNRHLNKEKVIVRNVGDRAISLRGWKIRNSDGIAYRFGRFRLAADSSVVLHSGRGNDTRRHLYWDRTRYVWHNGADVAKLTRPQGVTVDRCRYSGGGGRTACTGGGSGDGGTVDIEPGGNIQAAIDANPAGTTFRLSGTYRISTTIRPKTGNRFVGPATIEGAGAETGFQAKFGTGGARGVGFVDLDVSGFSQGVGCWAGTRVIGGRYHHNARNGIGCGLEGGGGVVIDGVEVDHNGSNAYLGCCSAGMKFSQGHGIVVSNSHVHDNVGIGVWCDLQCGDYRVVDNMITGNSRKGVHYEKSGASDLDGVVYEGMAIIARNVIQNNGYGTDESTNAGVIAVSSKNMLIEDNVFGGNALGNGIKIRQDSRLTGDTHGWVVSNITIRGNTMNGDNVDGCNLAGVRCS